MHSRTQRPKVDPGDVSKRIAQRLGTHREKFGLALEQITPAAFKSARG